VGVTVASRDESREGDEVLYGRDGLIWGMLNLHSLSTKLLCQATGNDLATLDKIHDVEEEVAGPSVIESMFSASCFQVLLRHETSRSCTEPLMVCPLCGYGREILSRSVSDRTRIPPVLLFKCGP